MHTGGRGRDWGPCRRGRARRPGQSAPRPPHPARQTHTRTHTHTHTHTNSWCLSAPSAPCAERQLRGPDRRVCVYSSPAPLGSSGRIPALRRPSVPRREGPAAPIRARGPPGRGRSAGVPAAAEAHWRSGARARAATAGAEVGTGRRGAGGQRGGDGGREEGEGPVAFYTENTDQKTQQSPLYIEVEVVDGYTACWASRSFLGPCTRRIHRLLGRALGRRACISRSRIYRPGAVRGMGGLYIEVDHVYVVYEACISRSTASTWSTRPVYRGHCISRRRACISRSR